MEDPINTKSYNKNIENEDPPYMLVTKGQSINFRKNDQYDFTDIKFPNG